MMRHRLLATKCFAIDTTAVKSMPCSIWYAACSTINLHWYNSIEESAINHWMPCFSASREPCEYRSSDRSTIMSRAISAWPIHRMQCARRAGPRRYWPSR